MSKKKNDDDFKRYQLRKEAAEMDAKLAGLNTDLAEAEQKLSDRDIGRSAIRKWILLWVLPPFIYVVVALPFPAMALVLTIIWLALAIRLMFSTSDYFSQSQQIGFLIPFTMIHVALGFIQNGSYGAVLAVLFMSMVLGFIGLMGCLDGLKANTASKKAALDEVHKIQRSIDSLGPLVQAAHELANPPETNVEEGDDFGDCTPHHGDGPQPVPA